MKMSRVQSPISMAKIIRTECKFNINDKIDLNRIIKYYHIKLKKVDNLSEKTAAASKVRGMDKLIVLNSTYPKMKYQKYESFTIAHEIGHIFLHKGGNICGLDVFGYQSTAMRENEANEFASELLLPRVIIQNKMKYRGLSIEMGQELSEHYGISLTASLLACVKNTTDEVILLYHSDSNIDWKYSSSDCWLKIDCRLNENQIIYEAKRVGKFKGGCEIRSWFAEDYDIECEQETIYLKNLQRYLTILNIVRK